MSEQILSQPDWRPRWYYVMRNKTTGKQYVGQTMRNDMGKYCGSGSYWVNHCRKNGGHNRSNIEIVEQIWIETEQEAQDWLDAFSAINSCYWDVENEDWANSVIETTKSSPFAGLTPKQRKSFSSLGGSAVGPTQGLKNVLNGHLDNIRKFAGEKTGRINASNGWMSSIGKTYGPSQGRKNVENGRLAAVSKLGANTLRLLKVYCTEKGITSPGKGFGNIDKTAFKVWREQFAEKEKE